MPKRYVGQAFKISGPGVKMNKPPLPFSLEFLKDEDNTQQNIAQTPRVSSETLRMASSVSRDEPAESASGLHRVYTLKFSSLARSLRSEIYTAVIRRARKENPEIFDALNDCDAAWILDVICTLAESTPSYEHGGASFSYPSGDLMFAQRGYRELTEISANAACIRVAAERNATSLKQNEEDLLHGITSTLADMVFQYMTAQFQVMLHAKPEPIRPLQ